MPIVLDGPKLLMELTKLTGRSERQPQAEPQARRPCRYLWFDRLDRSLVVTKSPIRASAGMAVEQRYPARLKSAYSSFAWALFRWYGRQKTGILHAGGAYIRRAAQQRHHIRLSSRRKLALFVGSTRRIPVSYLVVRLLIYCSIGAKL